VGAFARGPLAGLAVAAFLLISAVANAQEKAEEKEAPKTPPKAADGLPGSPRPPGVGLSPEAPPTPPAPGGRAPSFGAPTDKDAWVFRLGGRFSAWGQVGIGRSPENPSPSYEGGPALHTPPRILGRSPVYAGTAATLNF
jgi:hypothetical protein